MRRFCQLVLAACLAVAVAVAASWMDVPAGGGDVIGMSFLFVFRIGQARRWRFVPFLVSWWRLVSWRRPVSRLVLSSRVGVSFVSRGLAFSCQRWRFASRSASRPVLSRRSVSSGVSCQRCPVAPFLSAHFPVSSRLVLSLPSLSSCSFRCACRMALGRCGVAVRRGVVAVVRAIWVLRGDMRCVAAWRGVVR